MVWYAFLLLRPELDPSIAVGIAGVRVREAVAAVLHAEIDAYLADPQSRKRDPGFADQQAHEAKITDREQTSKARKYFIAVAPALFGSDACAARDRGSGR